MVVWPARTGREDEGADSLDARLKTGFDSGLCSGLDSGLDFGRAAGGAPALESRLVERTAGGLSRSGVLGGEALGFAPQGAA